MFLKENKSFPTLTHSTSGQEKSYIDNWIILFNPKLAIIKEKIVKTKAYLLYDIDFGNNSLNI